MMTQLRYQIQVVKSDGIGLDRNGDEIIGKLPPQDVMVAGWYQPEQETTSDADTDYRVKTRIVVITPPDIIGKRDEVIIKGITYRVISIQEYEANPFGWNPGLVTVECERVDG